MKRRDTARCGGVDHRPRAGDVAGREGGAIGRVDDPGDVDRRIGAVHQPRERVGLIERSPRSTSRRHADVVDAGSTRGPGVLRRARG